MTNKPKSQLARELYNLQEHLAKVEVRLAACETTTRDLQLTLEQLRSLPTGALLMPGPIKEASDPKKPIPAMEPVPPQTLDAKQLHRARLTSIGEMASSLAHEISRPLANILTYAQACLRLMATDSWTPDDIRKPLERIVAQAEFGARFVSRLRGFLSAGPAQRQSVDLNEQVQEVLQLCEAEFRDACGTLELHLEENLPKLVVDRLGIEQVILNLIRNALDAMQSTPPEQRRLVISTWKKEKEVILAVCDSGSGLSVETIQHLFQPFHSTKPTGMGMGLALSRGIIQQHGGRIWAKPNPEQGATFSFALPTPLGNEHHGSTAAATAVRVSRG
jgi:C4-dicarboxylate-specific signal transduction histidine kinase